MRQPDRIIRLNTVLDRTGLSRSTIYRKIAEGYVPASDQDQRQWRGMEGIRHQPMGRQPCRMEAIQRVRHPQ